MSKFNFNDIGLDTKPNITKIQENFEKIKELGITANEIGDNFFTTSGDFESSLTDGLSIYKSNYTLKVWRRGKLVIMNIDVTIPKIFGSVQTSYTKRILTHSKFKEWFRWNKNYLIGRANNPDYYIDSPTSFASNFNLQNSDCWAKLSLQIYDYLFNTTRDDRLNLYIHIPEHTQDDGVYNFNIFNFYEGQDL